MTDRRPARTRKTIDYSKFAGEESDGDDDFREISTQQPKRKKIESTSPKSLKVKLTKVDVESCKREVKTLEKEVKENGDDVSKKRPSLSDKVFQRHLSEALEISKQDEQLQSDENIENGNSSLLSEDKATEKKISCRDKADIDCGVSTDSIVSDSKQNVKQKETKGRNLKSHDDEWNDDASLSESSEDDPSDFSDDEEVTAKKPAGKKSRISKGVSDDESDWSDDDTKKKNKKPAVRKSVTKKQPQKSASPKVSQSTPVSLSCGNTTRKTAESNIISPSLKPNSKTLGTPCQVISSPVKLPPKGLRLGLSRKVPGKPLHSVIKVLQ